MAAALAGFGLVVDLPIHILENTFGRGVFALEGEPCGLGNFELDRGVEFVGCFLGEDLFIDEAAAPETDRIVVGLVEIDLIRAAILFRVRVGNRVPVVAVGIDLEDKRERFLVRPPDGVPGFCPDLVKILAIRGIPCDPVSLCALGQAVLDCGRPLHARPHRVLVVFDDVNHRELPERGQIERLVIRALVDSPVTQKAEAATFQALVFQAVGKAEAKRGLAGHDPVTAPVVFFRCEKMHRAALAARAAGGLAEKLRHAGVHVHPHRERVAVVPVGGDHVVVFPQERYRPNRDRFLADVKVEEPPHFALVVILQRRLLEPADAQHLREKPDFFISPEGRVDFRGGIVHRCWVFFGFAHENLVRFVLSRSACDADGRQTGEIPSVPHRLQ